MKHNYYERYFLFMLEKRSAIEVFRESAQKVVSYTLLDGILDNLKPSELQEFVKLLKESAYDAALLDASKLLLKHPLTLQGFEVLHETLGEVPDVCLGDKVPLVSLLNFCLYKILTQKYTPEGLLDVLKTEASDVPVRRSLSPRKTTAVCKDKRSREIMKAMEMICIELRSEKEGYKREVVSLLRKKGVKEKLSDYGIDIFPLIAILDKVGQVDAGTVTIEDLLVCEENRIYNLGKERRVILNLCVAERDVWGRCSVCGATVSKKRSATQINEAEVEGVLEGALGEEDIKTVHRIVIHKPNLAKHKYLRILLRVFGRFMREGKEERGDEFRCLVKAISCFSVDEEAVNLLISFLKTPTTIEAIELVPAVIKERRLAFSVFAMLLRLLEEYRTSRYALLVLQNVVFRYKEDFEDVMELIVEYAASSDRIGDLKLIQPLEKSANTDVSFLSEVFRDVALLFNTEDTKFVNKFIFHISKVARLHSFLSSSFLQSISNYIIVWNILSDQNFSHVVDSVDVLVGLLYNGHFTLSSFFKPSPSDFVRRNLAQIVFKLKDALQNKVYGSKIHCVYQILRHVLKGLSPSLYFKHAWPLIEHILSGKYEYICLRSCAKNTKASIAKTFSGQSRSRCRDSFLTWLTEKHYTPLVLPYLDMPTISNISDLQIVPGIERAVTKILRSYLRSSSSDVLFISSFLSLYRSDPSFRSKIAQILPLSPPSAVALIGDLPVGSNVIPDLFCTSPPSFKVQDVATYVLSNHLVSMQSGSQDIGLFLIQELLKHAAGPFLEDIEHMVAVFRSTRYKYLGPLPSISTLNPAHRPSHRVFLATLLDFLLTSLPRHEYLRYLLCLETVDALESALLCLIREYLQVAKDNDLVQQIERLRFCDKSTYEHLLEERSVDDRKTSAFILKINSYVGRSFIPRDLLIADALVAGENYVLIYLLDDRLLENPSEIELLRLAYFQAGDRERARELCGGSDAVRLFFEACSEGDFSAARECLSAVTGSLDGIYGSHLERQMQEILGNEEGNTHTGRSALLGFIKRLPKYALSPESLRSKVAEACRKTWWNRLELHLLKDAELLMCDDAYRLVGARRQVARDCDALLRVHHEMAKSLGHREFLRDVECEVIRRQIHRKDFPGCSRLIAKMLLAGDWEVLYEKALLRIAQRRTGEAREILRELIERYRKEETWSERFLRALVKYAELSRDEAVYEEALKDSERCKEFLGLESDWSEKSKRVCKEESKNRLIQEDVRLESLVYTNRLYFLVAKFFEKSDKLTALEYYSKTFRSNYESIPRFFHLISSLDRKEALRFDTLVTKILENKEELSLFLPFYTQIVNRLSVSCPAQRQYERFCRELLERFPHSTVWNTLELNGSRRQEIRVRIQSLVDSLSLSTRVILQNTQRIADQFVLISKSKKSSLSMKDFELPSMLPVAVSVPGHTTMIAGVCNEIYAFVSLQAPKRIILRGEDGVLYPIIVKFRDDLRKDSRVVDLCRLIEDLINKSEHSFGSKRLTIRKYLVIPLTNDAGLIEYLPRLLPLKAIHMNYYPNSLEYIKKFVKQRKLGYKEMPIALEEYKPIFHEHLKKVVPDPYSFYYARENYTITYAIMCAVGWFIGLGDRHAENVQFDSGTWETVHVDLNCIFDKGKTFTVPEAVPFRLTQNIVDGFGVLGVRGTFTSVFRHVLRVMRDNRDAILANMLSFVYDPLSEWGSKKSDPERILSLLERS